MDGPPRIEIGPFDVDGHVFFVVAIAGQRERAVYCYTCRCLVAESAGGVFPLQAVTAHRCPTLH
jgi:hypothetical protein